MSLTSVLKKIERKDGIVRTQSQLPPQFRAQIRRTGLDK